MASAAELVPVVGVSGACQAVGIGRASFYRHARRRQFTVGYKRRILTEADAARATGEISALLRREGLDSSHLVAWRRQRDEGILHALTPRRRGRPTHSPEQRELVRLRQENERLGQRLAAAEAVIEIQKKVAVLLGLAELSGASGERS
jgi:transposase